MVNECERLHETIIRDVYDVVTSVKDYDEVEWLRRKNNIGSIARRSSNLVVVFPVIVSTSLSIQTASIISKAIERKCAALLQILFSAAQITNADNLYDYLKQFHTNLNLKTDITLDDFLDAVDTLAANESGVQIVDRDMYEAVKEDMRNINYYLDNSYNPRSINDYKIKKNIYGESTIMLEDDKYVFKKGNRGNSVTGDQSVVYSGDVSNTGNNSNNTYNTTYNGGGMSAGRRGGIKDESDFFKSQLTQPEINKANELMPTLMLVNFITNAEEGRPHVQTTGVIGIKAKLYPVESMDIISRVVSKHKESNGLFNLVRASTREISFFRDLAFAVDKAKIDAVNMAKESNNAKMFRMLERRAAKNKFMSLIKRNDASPITSLVMSQEEVEYLKKYNNINMEKSYVTRSLLEAYNLLDIVLADESLETAKFLFDDGDGVFETLSFDSLEKEAKDSSYKKVINLMSKMNR